MNGHDTCKRCGQEFIVCKCKWPFPGPPFKRMPMPNNEFSTDPEHQPTADIAYGRDLKRYHSVLPEAQKMVHGDKQEKYGHPMVNFTRVAEYWKTYWKDRDIQTIRAEDVAVMKILMKVAREQNKHDRDNFVDIAGYADTGEMTHFERRMRCEK